MKGWVGWGGVKIISSNDIMCHVHSHPPSHHIGKILDGQSLISGKRVLVVHNTHRQQKNLQARNPCSVQETISSQNGQAQSFRYGFLSQVAPIRYGVIGCRCNVLTVNECGRPLRQGQHGCRFRTLSGCQQSSVLCCCLWKCVFGYTKLCLRSPDVQISLEEGGRSSKFFEEVNMLTFLHPFLFRRNGNFDFPKSFCSTKWKF